ncbi:hypothetical protein EC973_001588 [Apophysomyces ossiformis]|uniref:Uncharacterized protein n=1 Tax=Apophysomyces ossiformis TaxID=679940 RepID=A0A8H7EN26_9FUNG|nr:hypothetical protein EC973_001588 [Apophysomyces ossiformis]
MSLARRVQEQAPFYRKLKQEISGEHETSIALEAAIAEREKLTGLVEAKQVELQTLQKNSKKEFEDVRKMRHLSLRSAAATLTGKKKERIAKDEAKYHAAFESEQQCKRWLDDLSKDLSTATEKASFENQLQRQMGQYRSVKAQLSRMLEEVFSESQSGYPRESELKAELNNYLKQQQLATRDHTRFRDADHNLAQASREISQVMRLLEDALNYVPFDIFSGSMVDAEQIAYLEGAKRQTYEVQRRLNYARGVLPEIPYPATLDVVTNNLLLSLRVDLNFVDIAWKAKVSHTFAVMATAQRNIDNSITWVRQYMQYAEGALERLKLAVGSTKDSLEKERQRIFEGIMSGNLAEGSSSSHEIPQDQPPPVYEAPPSASNHQTPTFPQVPQNMSPMSASAAPLSNSSPYPSVPSYPSMPNQPPMPISPMMPGVNGTSYVTSNVNNPFQNVNRPV